MPPASSNSHGSRRARATLAWLQEQISSGAWPIDSRIPTEAELVEQMGVGRSTVREAVRSLANQGMLETAPGRGTFVRARTPVNHVLSDYLGASGSSDLLGLRRALEVEAAGMAAARRTDEDVRRLRGLLADQRARCEGGERRSDVAPGDFHAEVMELAGNEPVGDLFRSVMAVLRHRLAGGQLRLGEPAARHADHVALLDAIEAGDPTLARQVADQHCSRDLVES